MDEIQSLQSAADVPTLVLDTPWDWQEALAGRTAASLAALLARSISQRRWFGAKARGVRGLEIVEAVALCAGARLVIAEIDFDNGPPEVYQIPLAYAEGDKAARLLADDISSVWARVAPRGRAASAVVYDPLCDQEFCAALVALFDAQATLSGSRGEVSARQAAAYRALRGAEPTALPARLLSAEQSNSSLVFDERLILKIFRRVERGASPELEIIARLTERGFAHVPPLAGALEYQRPSEEPWSLGVLQAFVPNQGDAWSHTLARLSEFLPRAAVADATLPAELGSPSDGVSCAARRAIPSAVRAMFRDFLPAAELLGRRTAELHLALAADAGDPAFALEPLLPDDWRAACERAGEMTRETFALVERQLASLPADAAALARRVMPLESVAQERLRIAADQPAQVAKIRCHGDYHLGQVLVAGNDFVIIDFEGEPARPLGERRQKQLALRDVAGMVRSFHYAACSAAAAVKISCQADAGRTDALARAWYFWTSVGFLAAYREAAGDALFLPRSDDDFDRLLDMCLLEKAVYELRYELNNRPDWIFLPLTALADLLGRK